MRYFLLSLIAFFSLITSHQVSAQKAIAHKPAAKPSAKAVPFNLLTEVQLYELYDKVNVPAADEYLTNRKWRFNNSESRDSVDAITYSHTDMNGVTNGAINIFLCNSANNSFCIFPSFHKDNTRQHIFQINYGIGKSAFDILQASIRSRLDATYSKIGDNKIVTTYVFKRVRFICTIEKEDDDTKYRINFGDVSSSQLTKDE